MNQGLPAIASEALVGYLPTHPANMNMGRAVVGPAQLYLKRPVEAPREESLLIFTRSSKSIS